MDQIFAQTFTDYEILVVEDGSTDGTRKILESIRDPRLKVLVNQRNLGLTESLYSGVLEARGKYIARVDCGNDRISNKWLEKCVAPLEEDESVVLCGPRTRSWRGIEYLDSIQPQDPDILRWIFTLHNCVAHAGAVFRKIVGGEIQNYNRTFPLSQDYELWSRLSRIGRVHIVQECLVEILYSEGVLTEERKEQQDFYAGQLSAAQQNWLLGRDDIRADLANAAAGVYWRWKGVSPRDKVRGSWLLRRLRRAYLRQFGTEDVYKHLRERFYGLARWLFHRAEEMAQDSRWHAIQYLLAAWILDHSQLFTYRSLQVGNHICWRAKKSPFSPPTRL